MVAHPLYLLFWTIQIDRGSWSGRLDIVKPLWIVLCAANNRGMNQERPRKLSVRPIGKE